MAKRITIVQGHPDPAGDRFCHALASAYPNGARQAGHEVRTLDVARLDVPVMRTKEDFEHGQISDTVRECQQAIAWAQHRVVIYPLWLGTMPAALKGLLEQIFRPGFAVAEVGSGKVWKKLLKGRSARIVVTMGMPAFAYRWYFRARSLKSLERNVLGFVGIGPI